MKKMFLEKKKIKKKDKKDLKKDKNQELTRG